MVAPAGLKGPARTPEKLRTSKAFRSAAAGVQDFKLPDGIVPLCAGSAHLKIVTISHHPLKICNGQGRCPAASSMYGEGGCNAQLLGLGELPCRAL